MGPENAREGGAWAFPQVTYQEVEGAAGSYYMWLKENDGVLPASLEKNLDWDATFELDPIIELVASQGGSVSLYWYPLSAEMRARIDGVETYQEELLRDRAERYRRYDNLLEHFGIMKEPQLDPARLADILTIRDALLLQIDRQIARIDEMDAEIISVFKPYCFETLKEIFAIDPRFEEKETAETWELIRCGCWETMLDIRRGASGDSVADNLSLFDHSMVPERFASSLRNGLEELLPNRAPVWKSLRGFLDQLQPHEWIVEQALAGLPVRPSPEWSDAEREAKEQVITSGTSGMGRPRVYTLTETFLKKMNTHGMRSSEIVSAIQDRYEEEGHRIPDESTIRRHIGRKK